MQNYLRKALSPSLQDENGQSALHFYVKQISDQSGMTPVLKELLSKLLEKDQNKSLINLQDSEGRTALYQAASRKNASLAKQLI